MGGVRQHHPKQLVPSGRWAVPAGASLFYKESSAASNVAVMVGARLALAARRHRLGDERMDERG